MSSPVAELEAGLNAMLGLKPPGVSGSQIKNLTALCVDNVQVGYGSARSHLGIVLCRSRPVFADLPRPF